MIPKFISCVRLRKYLAIELKLASQCFIIMIALKIKRMYMMISPGLCSSYIVSVHRCTAKIIKLKKI
jgi:hypothetical protein